MQKKRKKKMLIIPNYSEGGGTQLALELIIEFLISM
jgi:hypothetical protein